MVDFLLFLPPLLPLGKPTCTSAFSGSCSELDLCGEAPSAPASLRGVAKALLRFGKGRAEDLWGAGRMEGGGHHEGLHPSHAWIFTAPPLWSKTTRPRNSLFPAELQPCLTSHRGPNHDITTPVLHRWGQCSHAGMQSLSFKLQNNLV